MTCSPPSEQPSFFEVGGYPLVSQAFICRVSSSNASNLCTLNITKIFHRLPTKAGLSQFYFALICTSPLRVTFHRPKHFVQVDLISYLDIRGCEVTAKDLAAWGQTTDLRVLYLRDGVTLREEENQTASDLEGLFNIGTLALLGLSNKVIPRMFTSFVWDKMAEVQLTKMSLTSIPDVLKKTMPNLQSLELSHNALHKPPDFPWCNNSLKLPRNLSRTAFGNEHYSQEATVNPRIYRRFFSVDHNPGLNVRKYEFPAGTLDRVSLRGNELQHINRRIFHKIGELQVIDLSRNNFKEIPPQLFRKANGLVHINLANNRLEILVRNTFGKLTKLRRLDVSHNFISILQNRLLNSLENLEEINLQNNSLKRIAKRALPFGSNSLKRINLQRNYLQRIPKCAFLSRNLEVFDMSDNMVSDRSFLNALDTLDLNAFRLSHSKSASSVDEKSRASLKAGSKIVLRLKRNKIEQFDFTQFDNTRLQKLEWILKAYTLNIENNPFVCDCRVPALQLKLKNWTRTVKEINEDQFDSWMCHSPEDLRGDKILSVPEEQLKCKSPYAKCPRQCKCYKRSAGFPIFVDCRNRSLTELPDEVPDGLVELRLEYNQIENFTFQETLRNVTFLRISHNNLQLISSKIFHSLKLDEIFLDSNQLTTLPKLFENLNLSKIDIRNNFFRCDCQNKWMKKWLLRMDRAFVGGARSVSCISEENLRKPMISVKDGDFICLKDEILGGGLPLKVAYILGTLIFILVLSGFIYRFREEIKLLIFTRLRWHPFDRVDDSDPSKIYDAFVSYSSRDREWVLNTLREKLESEDPPYKLCIHDRDFLVGAPIFQNIFDSVKTSRRMIMVLSNNFLQSEWCMLEFRAAHRKVLRDRTNYLIIVLLDDVDIKNLDDELNLYLRTNTYLKIDNKWFWERLRYALPQKRQSASQTSCVVVENGTYGHEISR